MSQVNTARPKDPRYGGSHRRGLLRIPLHQAFFGYGSVEMDYDEFREHRVPTLTALGVGYYWIKEEEHEFKTRGGLGYLHETYLPEWDNDGQSLP